MFLSKEKIGEIKISFSSPTGPLAVLSSDVSVKSYNGRQKCLDT